MIAVAVPILVMAGVYECKSDDRLVIYEATAGKGDTLWGLCAKVASNRDNLMDVVERAMRENGINRPENLQPGQTVRIKVKLIEKAG